MEKTIKLRSKNSIHICDQISKVRYEQFGLWLKILIVLVGIGVFIASNFYLQSKLTKALGFALAFWFIISYNYPVIILSDRRAREYGMKFPPLFFEFGGESVCVTTDYDDSVLEIMYKDIIRLVEDEYGFYFYRSDHYGYIVLKQDTDVIKYQEIKDLLIEKTNLPVKSRRIGGLTPAFMRVRDGIENALYVLPFLRNFIDQKRADRKEYEAGLEAAMEEKKKAAIRQKEIDAENLKKEEELSKELRENPEKLEEFKKSVHR